MVWCVDNQPVKASKHDVNFVLCNIWRVHGKPAMLRIEEGKHGEYGSSCKPDMTEEV